MCQRIGSEAVPNRMEAVLNCPAGANGVGDEASLSIRLSSVTLPLWLLALWFVC